MHVGEICTHEVITTSSNVSIHEAAQLMRKHHVGNVVVVEERTNSNVPIGILTDRDIVIGLIAADVDLESVTVGDVMTVDPVCAHEKDDVLSTVRRMREKGVRRMPVINDLGGLEGIVAVDDFIELISGQLMDLGALVANCRLHENEKRPPLPEKIGFYADQ